MNPNAIPHINPNMNLRIHNCSVTPVSLPLPVGGSVADSSPPGGGRSRDPPPEGG